MMYYYERPRFGFGLNGSNITKAVKYLIIANGVLFLFKQIFSTYLIYWFGLLPNIVFANFYVWQFFTYMFLHGDFIHILLNMFILWMFGCEVERYMGFSSFLKYYFFCGVGGGLFHVLLHSNSQTPVIGASGAIYGILAAFAILFPDRRIMLFPFFITLKAKHLVLIFFGITLLFGIIGKQDGIAHFAHFGGMIFGFLFLKVEKHIANMNEIISTKQQQRKFLSLTKKRRRYQQLRDEVDGILDKIIEVGYENLTNEEKTTLKEASDLFSKE